MIFSGILFSSALAIEREEVLHRATHFATWEWTMSEENETASCSEDYISDYVGGNSYIGIPYDWGGWVTTEEYEEGLAQGYGAGSHSWHGVLSCTVGLDCSGFVSQTWGTDQKYGTSTFYQVTETLGVEELKRGDALNKAGSHIVLFAHQTDDGVPVHYETNGTVVFVDSDEGWSAFSDYESIRYEDIEDGPSTGTGSEPIEIESMPYEDLRWTAGAASDVFDYYSCAPETNESGPEQLYRFSVAQAGSLVAVVSDDSGVDVDLHLLSAPDEEACLARDDSVVERWLEPGEYWLSLDTYVAGDEFPGPYLLTVDFSGTLGEADPGGGTDSSSPGGGDSGMDPSIQSSPQPESDPDRQESASQWERVPIAAAQGCQTPAPAAPWLASLGLLLLGRRRRG